jgi:hypothetical protein
MIERKERSERTMVEAGTPLLWQILFHGLLQEDQKFEILAEDTLLWPARRSTGFLEKLYCCHLISSNRFLISLGCHPPSGGKGKAKGPRRQGEERREGR